MTCPDRRRNAFRPGLADRGLADVVQAETFVEGRPAQVVVAIASIRREPRFDAMQVTEALLGETVRVFDEREGWAWVQLDADGYVGYVSADALANDIVSATHRIAVPATFVYPQPSLKSQPAEALTLNARVPVAGDDGEYARLANGRFVFRGHLRQLSDRETDYVAVAARFLHVPYYWGGKSVHGLDCSGLVQLAFEACGLPCPRDSDMQEVELGEAVPAGDLALLQRGDLVFWDGHVGIMADGVTLLHANGFHMMVVEEPLAAAAARIAGQGKNITAIRRLRAGLRQ